jgi:hypothetical protein
VKFDARSGRFTRIDRAFDGENYVSTPTDITEGFKAVFDLENTETGWMDFSGGAPSISLVKVSDLDAGRATMPPQPSEAHKNGVRFLIKLSPASAGEHPPIREMMSSAKAFVAAIEELDAAYVMAMKAYPEPNKLPVVVLDGLPRMIKTGSGTKTSTAFSPRFKIVAWANRGDLVYVPKASMPAKPAAAAAPAQAQASNGSRPTTGAQPAPAPRPAAPAALGVDPDFG